eukprot:m.367518 g.367518  ORF g.367518 m.367518 type:complete len:385 (+) comp20835_c0_seq1:209-1363(+)
MACTNIGSAAADGQPTGSNLTFSAELTESTSTVNATNTASVSESTACASESKASASDSHTTGNNGDNTTPQLSKNAKKRLARDLAWAQGAEARRKKRRLKQKEAAKKKKELYQEQGVKPPTNPRKRSYQGPIQTQQRVAIDMDFDKYHQVKDVKKLIKQVQTCYAVNRRGKAAVDFHLTSLTGMPLARMKEVNGMSWKINTHEKPYHEAFPKESIIYLSSESENVLSTLDDTKVYVIGGLVDHNRFKGLTHKMALERGMAHARLPILEHFTLNSRTVLTVNHVFEILVHFVGHHDWPAAIAHVIPERKGLAKKSGGAPNEEASATEQPDQGDGVSGGGTDGTEDSDALRTQTGDPDTSVSAHVPEDAETRSDADTTPPADDSNP